MSKLYLMLLDKWQAVAKSLLVLADQLEWKSTSKPAQSKANYYYYYNSCLGPVSYQGPPLGAWILCLFNKN